MPPMSSAKPSSSGMMLPNRAKGVAARTRRRFSDDQADDEVIAERIRSELGHVVSHPGAIDVSVEDGRATLTGAVLEEEAVALIHGVHAVRGVREIVDRLERHEDAEDVPGLQGAGRPAEPRFELMQES